MAWITTLFRILYSLQMLPLYLPKKKIQDTEKAVSNFMRDGKKPKQRLRLLQLHTDMDV